MCLRLLRWRCPSLLNAGDERMLWERLGMEEQLLACGKRSMGEAVCVWSALRWPPEIRTVLGYFD